MSHKLIIVFIVLTICVSGILTACNAKEIEVEKTEAVVQDWSDYEYNVIPNADTAVKVAEIYLKNIYGKELIDEQKPFRVCFDSDSKIWVVNGTVNTPGGNLSIAINMKDGKVLNIETGE